MVAEACLWAHEQGFDFSKYDWDGDGEVDQVFVLYAGHGEASYDKDPNTIGLICTIFQLPIMESHSRWMA